MIHQRRFTVQFDLVFDTEDLDTADRKQLQQLTEKRLKKAINAAFIAASYDFFGESVCSLGLLTPTVSFVKETK